MSSLEFWKSMRKAGGIRTTLVLVNKVADPIGEDEGRRWRESTLVEPSLTLVFGATSLWRRSCAFAEGLVQVFCPLHHLFRCPTPAEGKPCWVSLSSHAWGLTSHVLHRGCARQGWRCLMQPHSVPSSRACSVICRQLPRDLDCRDTWATGELESMLATAQAQGSQLLTQSPICSETRVS